MNKARIFTHWFWTEKLNTALLLWKRAGDVHKHHSKLSTCVLGVLNSALKLNSLVKKMDKVWNSKEKDISLEK